MKRNLQAFSVEIETSKSGWVHICPIGKNHGYDGRGPYVLKNPQAVIDASKRQIVDLFIDRDHETLFMPRGTKIVAAGWIKKMEAREDGIWAFVEWTEKAAEQLEAKEYRYLSPVFKHDPVTGEILSIGHASLTINPNFELTAAASADETLNQNQEETKPMEDLLKQLAALLGLAETATQEEVLAAVKARASEVAAASAEASAVREALKLDNKADATAVIAAASAIAAGTQEPDPKKYVPMSAFTEISDRVAALQKNEQTRSAEEAVSNAVKSRKISPAMKNWALSYASSDLTGFQKYVATAPVIVAASADPEGNPERKSEELPDEIKKLSEQLGVKEEDVKKILAEESAA